jgi:hypothetical protein
MKKEMKGTQNLASSRSADTGNASNPTPHEDRVSGPGKDQLLGKEAEKYIRESASIEDLPDPQDELDADETLSQEDKS